MSWYEVTRGWSELYENSPKTQKFFEDAAPTIAKLGISYFSGSSAAGEVAGKALSVGGGASSTIKKAAGFLAYSVAVGAGTAVVGLAMTATAPVWIPVLIFADRKKG